MKPRDIFGASVVFFACMLFAVNTAWIGIRNQPLASIPKLLNAKPKTYQVTSSCSNDGKIANLTAATSPELRKLDLFQQACNSKAAGTVMIFNDMPKDTIEAKTKADQMALKLKEFSKYGVRPLVITEPTASWGFVDFGEFKQGMYDPWINAYFAELKAQGITDEQMGIWVPFPEANLPYWNNQSVKPEDFGVVVTKYVQMQKAVFPKSKASIMLNSASYDASDFNWENGEYISLVPFLKDIPKGLIDSFGLQGFPWAPRATAEGAGHGLYDASEYLNYKLTEEAAAYLGVKDVWMNTGSFHTKYTSDPKQTVTLTPATRKDILTTVNVEALKLQKDGYHVSVNIFAEDKSTVAEETDWSYWDESGPKYSEDAIVFNNFASLLRTENIDLWVFDR